MMKPGIGLSARFTGAVMRGSPESIAPKTASARRDSRAMSNPSISPASSFGLTCTSGRKISRAAVGRIA